MMSHITYLSYCLISFFCVYKWIRHIDKKERKYLKQWEKEYVEAYAEIWKEQYFLRLAEEKKLKEIAKKREDEKAEQRERLKNVKIEDEEEFMLDYDKHMQKAEETLIKEEDMS